MPRLSLVMLGAILLAGTPVRAAGPALPRIDTAGLLPALAGGSTDALAGALRGFLVQSMPEPLYEKHQDWGRQQKNFRGKMKNDGHWKHIHVHAVHPADTLVFDIRHLNHAEPGRVTFTVYLSFDVRGEYEHIHWESGFRLRSTSLRARCRLRVTMHCEATYRLEPGAQLLPDAVFRLRVTRSDVQYDNFVTEHIAGFGGDMAKLLGDAVRSSMKQWHPSLERDLLAKANERIERSADTREVRVNLYEVIKKKGWGSAPPRAAPVPPPAAPAPLPPSPPPPTPVKDPWQPVYP